jgi:flavorubredoxin
MTDNSFKAQKITDDIYWVGAIDWGIRNFHGYSTNLGTTYNAYLILGEKPILVDTVKAPFRDELVRRISSVIDPKEIAYIISNHSEMDHSGCLPDMIDLIRPEKVFASVMGQKALAAHFHRGTEITAVKDGERAVLGGREVLFLETRMLHWPDSMFSYFPAEKILFSNDAFGMHLASLERFAEELDPDTLEHEAKKYYANILLPYSNLVAKLFDRVRQSGLEFSLIAPDHGPVWRRSGDIERIFGRWETWALQKPTRKAIVVFDTMWRSTELMARAIGEGLASGGVHAVLLPLRGSNRSDVATEMLDAGALVVGSPTLNNSIFPTVADVLTYLKGLRPKNLLGAAFGSYGWGGESVAQLEGILAEMKTEPVGESVRIQYVPDEPGLARCREFGANIAAKLVRYCETT